ncbi:MAG: putative acetyltransferase [Salibacteraceae bacterium]|jgi:GNAT superfamily N-acetyltransferase
MNSTLLLTRTHSNHSDFSKLVNQLDQYLTILDGDQHDFYNQFNNIDVLKNVVIAFDENTPVGCGAFKELEEGVIELKRMFTDPRSRGKKVASQILSELEDWAISLGYHKVVLETGVKMPDAIGLYKKFGYVQVPNYGPYAGKELSVCFEKNLKIT